MTTIASPAPADEPPRFVRRLRDTVRFLDDLLSSPCHLATIDGTDSGEVLTSAFEGSGKWRGNVPLALSRMGVISRVRAPEGSLATRRARRRHRKSGEVGLWRLVDRDEAERIRRDCAARLEQLPSEPRQQTLFEMD